MKIVYLILVIASCSFASTDDAQQEFKNAVCSLGDEFLDEVEKCFLLEAKDIQENVKACAAKLSPTSTDIFKEFTKESCQDDILYAKIDECWGEYGISEEFEENEEAIPRPSQAQTTAGSLPPAQPPRAQRLYRRQIATMSTGARSIWRRPSPPLVRRRSPSPPAAAALLPPSPAALPSPAADLLPPSPAALPSPAAARFPPSPIAPLPPSPPASPPSPPASPPPRSPIPATPERSVPAALHPPSASAEGIWFQLYKVGTPPPFDMPASSPMDPVTRRRYHLKRIVVPRPDGLYYLDAYDTTFPSSGQL